MKVWVTVVAGVVEVVRRCVNPVQSPKLSVPEAGVGGPVVLKGTGVPAMHRVGGAWDIDGLVYQGAESTARE